MKNNLGRMFQVRRRDQTGSVIYYLSGVLDEQGGKVLWETLKNNKVDSDVIQFNLSELTLISSSGVGIIVETVKEFSAQGKLLKLTHPSPMVERMLRLVHLDQLLEIK